jgi:predicted HTH transcriptional regulator
MLTKEQRAARHVLAKMFRLMQSDEDFGSVVGHGIAYLREHAAPYPAFEAMQGVDEHVVYKEARILMQNVADDLQNQAEA